MRTLSLFKRSATSLVLIALLFVLTILLGSQIERRAARESEILQVTGTHNIISELHVQSVEPSIQLMIANYVTLFRILNDRNPSQDEQDEIATGRIYLETMTPLFGEVRGKVLENIRSEQRLLLAQLFVFIMLVVTQLGILFVTRGRKR